MTRSHAPGRPPHSRRWHLRVPALLLGAILGPVGAFMRRNVDESPDFEKSGASEAPAMPTATFVRRVIQTFAFGVFWGGGAYMVLVYMASFAHTYASIGHVQALWSSSLALFIFAVFSPVMGAVSDRIGRKPLVIVSCLLFAFAAYPAYGLLLGRPSLVSLMLVQGLMALAYTLFTGPGPALVSEMFPTRVRATGVSIGIGLSAVMGGFAPMIATWLIRNTGNPQSAGWLLSGFAAISFVAILTIPASRRA